MANTAKPVKEIISCEYRKLKGIDNNENITKATPYTQSGGFIVKYSATHTMAMMATLNA